MAVMQTGADEDDPRRLPKERMLALSDGVFSVALTLLIVDIATFGHIPQLDHAGDWWNDLWPKLLSYLYSFFVVSVFWVAHHNEMNFIERVTRELLWLNIFFLFFIVLIPFSAALLGSNWRLSENDGFWYQRIPFCTYIANLALAGAALQAEWFYVSRHRDVIVGKGRTPAIDSDIDRANWRNLIVPGFATLVFLIGVTGSIQLGQILIICVPISYAAWTLIAAWLIRRRRHKAARLGT